MGMEESGELCATKRLGGAFEVLEGVLQFGSEVLGMEMVGGGGGGEGFDGMMGYRVEEVVNPRLEGGCGGCCSYVLGL
jgi:hypothetical protein